ncbi:MAG: hypothetical protein ABL926_08040 [Novosphingobium sp.]|uniref:hypothetical protein n=1 Tax=Novosphingobium sp. TaxID=1874826 RepID=UPI0032B7C6F3
MVAIKIIKRPAGEAPEWVRDAWIGLELIAVNDAPAKTLGFGVLSGPKGRLGQLLGIVSGRAVRYEGFVVRSGQAIACLSAHNSEAANWWRENCPNFIKPKGGLLFRTDECEIIRTTSPWR